MENSSQSESENGAVPNLKSGEAKLARIPSTSFPRVEFSVWWGLLSLLLPYAILALYNVYKLIFPIL